MRDNEYILHGYVPPTNSYRQCLRSLTYLHNESVNIYTHLVPGLLVAAALLVPVEYLVPVFPTTTGTDRWYIRLFLVGAATCLLASATFHTCKCHLHPVAVAFNMLDYVGIVVLILTLMVGIIHYSFQDHSVLRTTFLAMVLVLGVGCFGVSVDRRFREPAWRSTRAAMFVAFGLSAVVPVVTGVVVYGVDEAWKRGGIGHVLLEAVGYIGGAALYAVRVPEKRLPGRFDYFGNLHQVFHVLVVLAAWSHWRGLVQSYVYAHRGQ